MADAVRKWWPMGTEAEDRLVGRLQQSGVGQEALKPGDMMPPFLLPDETGEEREGGDGRDGGRVHGRGGGRGGLVGWGEKGRLEGWGKRNGGERGRGGGGKRGDEGEGGWARAQE